MDIELSLIFWDDHKNKGIVKLNNQLEWSLRVVSKSEDFNDIILTLKRKL